jgi:ribosomal protein S12 methylthiotransferase accessory factor YcaO
MNTTDPKNPGEGTTISKPVDYRLQLIRTESATGYFSVYPENSPDFGVCLAYARAHPNDEFMRRQLLRFINSWGDDALAARISDARPEDLFLRGLYCEACLLNPRFSSLRRCFDADSSKELARHTPLVFLRAEGLADHALHSDWIRFFRENIFQHKPLIPTQTKKLAGPYDDAFALQALQAEITLPEVFKKISAVPDEAPSGRVPAAEIAALARERLEKAGVSLGPEMRHESSLSPVALLRKWPVNFEVRSGRQHFRFKGEQTAYGRGFKLEDARAACLMEIVERRSAYADIDRGRTIGYSGNHALIHARVSDLQRDAVAYLDPNRLTLEAPCPDEALYWVEGVRRTPEGERPVYVPLQCAVLFCNLDEVKLFSALGSTGLAAGASLEEAKVRALLEIIERDSESVMPFTPGMCFDLEALSPGIAMLLENYAELGIQVQFQDITTELGVPCCKCFVVDSGGQVAKGTGAHLDAGRALLSAMTETPYPYPEGPPSRPGLPDRLRVCLESLPDYSSVSASRDLQVLETLLLGNGYQPIYINLTREDLGLPVVRALLPGMEMLGDFDPYARVNPRLYGRYLKLVQAEKQKP